MPDKAFPIVRPQKRNQATIQGAGARKQVAGYRWNEAVCSDDDGLDVVRVKAGTGVKGFVTYSC